MNPTPYKRSSATLSFDTLNWIATDCLPRDRAQSRRLHEPEQILSTIDPITGMEIEDTAGHPYIVDGNLVIYFESELTRQEYKDMPIDHPFRLRDNPYEEGEAEG
jgi:YHS domain-containing protein